MKHIDVAYLWIQDEVRSRRLQVRRVRSEDNIADLGTKPPSKAVIAKHCHHIRVHDHESGRCPDGTSIMGRLWDFGSACSR